MELQIERGEERERKPHGRDTIRTATEQGAARLSNGLSLPSSLSLDSRSRTERISFCLAQRAMGVHVARIEGSREGEREGG